MKYLAFLFLVVSCGQVSLSKYKEKFHIADYESKQPPEVLWSALHGKMKKCYTLGNKASGVSEGTYGKFDPATHSGYVGYDVHSVFGRMIIHYLEVSPSTEGSKVMLWSEGDLIRTTEEFQLHIRRWLEGKVSLCRGHGEI